MSRETQPDHGPSHIKSVDELYDTNDTNVATHRLKRNLRIRHHWSSLGTCRDLPPEDGTVVSAIDTQIEVELDSGSTSFFHPICIGLKPYPDGSWSSDWFELIKEV